MEPSDGGVVNQESIEILGKFKLGISLFVESAGLELDSLKFSKLEGKERGTECNSLHHQSSQRLSQFVNP